MLPIYLCEDNIPFMQSLNSLLKKSILKENLNMNLEFCTSDPYELLMRVKTDNTTGIYILDIDLKADINGLELAQQIRKIDPRGYIVFVTTHEEMTLLTFKYKIEALDYIIKDDENLSNRVNASLLQINERHNTIAIRDDGFSFRIGDKVIFEKYENIYLFEVSATVHKIIMVAENRQLEFYSSLNSIKEHLDDRFLRCSNAMIINTDKIIEVNKKKRIAILSNEEECAISVRNMKHLLAYMQ